MAIFTNMDTSTVFPWCKHQKQINVHWGDILETFGMGHINSSCIQWSWILISDLRNGLSHYWVLQYMLVPRIFSPFSLSWKLKSKLWFCLRMDSLQTKIKPYYISLSFLLGGISHECQIKCRLVFLHRQVSLFILRCNIVQPNTCLK